MSTPRAELLAIPEDTYHADTFTDAPCLSKSIAQILLTRSPLHAWAAHPKLNPNFVKPAEKKFDIGTSVHALFLEGDANVAVIEADNWTTKAAKEQRDEARANGMTPLLAKDWERVQEMADAIGPQLDRFNETPTLFTDGKPEQTLVWEEDGVLCKARLDWIRDNLTAVDDLKTTSASAAPEKWSKTMLGMGAELQVAFYLRGLRHLTDTPPAWRFVVVETEPPYALSVFSVAPDLLEIADRKVQFAIDTWRECLKTGVWPGYPSRVCWIHESAWAENEWAERQYRDEEEAA